MKAMICMLSLSTLFGSAIADGQWSPEQAAVLDAIEQLNVSTSPSGSGAEAYGELLAEDFTRWTVGSSEITNRSDWIAGVRDWYDDGWRVKDREARVLEISVLGDLAMVRRVVREVYAGPEGATNESTAALAEVWVRDSGNWLLLRADVHPMGG